MSCAPLSEDVASVTTGEGDAVLSALSGPNFGLADLVLSVTFCGAVLLPQEMMAIDSVIKKNAFLNIIYGLNFTPVLKRWSVLTGQVKFSNNGSVKLKPQPFCSRRFKAESSVMVYLISS